MWKLKKQKNKTNLILPYWWITDKIFKLNKSHMLIVLDNSFDIFLQYILSYFTWIQKWTETNITTASRVACGIIVSQFVNDTYTLLSLPFCTTWGQRHLSQADTPIMPILCNFKCCHHATCIAYIFTTDYLFVSYDTFYHGFIMLYIMFLIFDV